MRARSVATLVALACSVLFCGLSPAQDGTLRIYCIRTGLPGCAPMTRQGDSTLVISPDGTSLLIDGGGNGSCGSDSVIRLLEEVIPDGDTLDYVVATHWHDDHIDGLDNISSYNRTRYRPDVIYSLSDYESAGPAYNEEFGHISAEYPDVRQVPAVEEVLALDDDGTCTATFVSVDGDIYGGGHVEPGTDANNRSIGLLIKYGQFDYLTLGDLGTAQEDALSLELRDEFNIDVLHVSHHGSAGSTSSIFLDRIRPEYAVIFCGDGNNFHHPAQATINRLNGWNDDRSVEMPNPPVQRTYLLEAGIYGSEYAADPDDPVTILGHTNTTVTNQGSLLITVDCDGKRFYFQNEGPNTNSINDPCPTDEGGPCPGDPDPPLPPTPRPEPCRLCRELFECVDDSVSPPVWCDGWDWTYFEVDPKTTRAHSGNFSAQINARADELVTPGLNNPGMLSFWYYPTQGSLQVDYGSAADGPWTPFDTITVTAGQWNHVEMDLSEIAATSPTIYIRFQLVPADSNQGYHYIDDVEVLCPLAIDDPLMAPSTETLVRRPATSGMTEIFRFPPPAPEHGTAWLADRIYARSPSASRPRICVLVEDRFRLRDGAVTSRDLGPRLYRYRDDLAAAGYSCEIFSVAGSAPESIRNFLRAKYEEAEGLAGCLLVGDLYPIWFEQAYLYPYGMVHHQYPADLYFSSLYADWSDVKHWGVSSRDDLGRPAYDLLPGGDRDKGAPAVYDTVADASPRIFVGRLTPSSVAADEAGEYRALCDYLDRNHAFRTGVIPRTFRASALMGIGVYWPWFSAARDALFPAFESYLPAELTVDDYFDTVFGRERPLDILYLLAHGSAACHRIGPCNGDYATNLRLLDETSPGIGEAVQPLLVHLDSCYAGNFAEENGLGGCYLFSPGSRCLACIAPASLSNWTRPSFWEDLTRGADLGTAFRRNWSSFSWTLQGDPTLRFPGRRVSAPPLPPPSVEGCAVTPPVVRKPLPAGALAIRIVFSRSMNTSVAPAVTYDPAGAVGSQRCGRGLWSSTVLPYDTYTVRGVSAIDAATGNGTANVYVSGAQCADGSRVPAATAGTFRIEIDPR